MDQVVLLTFPAVAGYGDVATTKIYTHVVVEEPSQLDGHALILRLG